MTRADRLDRPVTRRPDAATAAATSARPDHPARPRCWSRGDAIAWVGDRRRPTCGSPATADEVVDLGRRAGDPGVRRRPRARHLDRAGADRARPHRRAPAWPTASTGRGRRAAGPRGGVVLGHGWDETTWPEHRRTDPPGAGPGVVRRSGLPVPGRRALGRGLLGAARRRARGRAARTAGRTPGTSPGRRTTSYAGWPASRSRRPSGERAAAGHPRSAPPRWASALLHELPARTSPAPTTSRALLELSAAEPGPEVVGYWGELASLGGVEPGPRARRRWAPPATCSPTARSARTPRACATPYADARRTPGTATSTAAQVRDHVVACTEAGLQAGFHAIGDGALDAVVAGLRRGRRAAGRGPAAGGPAPHRARRDGRRRSICRSLADLGVVASVQPAFDRLWGGETGMYAERLGAAAGAVPEPVRGDGGGRHRAGARLGLAGHAARPVGQRPGRGPAPDARLRARRPRPRSPPTPAAAGGRPRRDADGVLRRRRAGDLRGLGRRRARPGDRAAAARGRTTRRRAAVARWCAGRRCTTATQPRPDLSVAGRVNAGCPTASCVVSAPPWSSPARGAS